MQHANLDHALLHTPILPVFLGGHATDGPDLVKVVEHVVLQQHAHAEGCIPSARVAHGNVCLDDAEDLVPAAFPEEPNE
jgi:hypothetical protein